MHTVFIRLVFSLTACLTASAAAAMLFSNDFQDSSTSNAQWAYPSAMTHTVVNGEVSLKNNDSAYLWFATHNMSAKAATFTLSATITITSSASNGAGIACCLDASNNGIALQVGTGQNLFVYEYNANVQQLLVVVNSFVTTGVNSIQISKRDSTFTVFCNGKFMTTFFVSSAKFMGGGDIGMILPAKAQAKFDNVTMTDQYQSGSPITCFSDDFSDAAFDGWYTASSRGNFW